MTSTATDTPTTATAEALAELATVVEIRTDKETLLSCSRDASRAVPEGLPAALAKPKNTMEVAAVLTWATRHRVPVSVRGAGTGLSGGAVAYRGGIVVSTAKLTRLEIEPATLTAVVGAGVVTSQLNAAAAEHGLMYAPDPVSANWSTIGGNIATDAGGPRCLSYGVTADAVAHLEVVLPDGRIIHSGSRTRKNSTGYDLKSLFIGSEGTLGIITEAVVRLRPGPVGEEVAFAAAFPELSGAGDAVIGIMAMGVTPHTLELMDRNTITTVARHFPDEEPLAGAAVLVGNLTSPHANADVHEIERVCTQYGGVTTTGQRATKLLETRQRVNPALNASGLVASCDIAVPIDRLSRIFRDIAELSEEHGMQVNTFAHAGDGNLHPAVVIPPGDEEALERAEELLDAITKAALKLGGVISGEHGIGSLKRHHLAEQLDEATLQLQRQIKTWFDPCGILTPGRAI